MKEETRVEERRVKQERPMAVTIFDLSEDAATAILSHLPLVEYLPKAISSLRLASKDGTAWLSSDTVWTFLEASLPGSTGSAAPPTPSRRSSRLVLSSQQSFVAAWRLMLQRSEALHHAVAMAGQDDKDLTASRLRVLIDRWGPLRPVIDRASPVYNATLLMQVCRGRVREANLIACAERLICHEGCNPSARPPYENSCTPLIIAASRGLAKLTALLLACGADISPRGEGRFRLCGRAASIAGCWRAIEWVRKLREAEAAAGVTDHDDGLYRCQRLLELAEERRQQQQRLQECGATCDGRWSKGWKAAGERAAQLLREAAAASGRRPRAAETARQDDGNTQQNDGDAQHDDTVAESKCVSHG